MDEKREPLIGQRPPPPSSPSSSSNGPLLSASLMKDRHIVIQLQDKDGHEWAGLSTDGGKTVQYVRPIPTDSKGEAVLRHLFDAHLTDEEGGRSPVRMRVLTSVFLYESCLWSVTSFVGIIITMFGPFNPIMMHALSILFALMVAVAYVILIALSALAAQRAFPRQYLFVPFTVFHVCLMGFLFFLDAASISTIVWAGTLGTLLVLVRHREYVRPMHLIVAMGIGSALAWIIMVLQQAQILFIVFASLFTVVVAVVRYIWIMHCYSEDSIAYTMDETWDAWINLYTGALLTAMTVCWPPLPSVKSVSIDADTLERPDGQLQSLPQTL